MDYSKRPQESNRNLLWRLLATANIVLLIFLVSYSVILSKKESSHTEEAHRPHHHLNLVNPALSTFDLTQTASEMKNKISAFYNDEKTKGNIIDASFYFRDLDTGHGLGENEHDEFIPASLLKLPTAIAYYKHAESDPGIMNRELEIPDHLNSAELQTIPPEEVALPGKKYKVEELIKKSLAYSDNNSNTVLVDNFDDAEYVRVFQELNVDLPQEPDDRTVTVRDYAGIFRNLYNANYLNLESSQKVLSYLIESEYDSGIKSGIPDFVKIANKFGERSVSEIDHYLHDCGIIYAIHPYVLCVMTEGENRETLPRILSETSRIVYETMGE